MNKRLETTLPSIEEIEDYIELERLEREGLDRCPPAPHLFKAKPRKVARRGSKPLQ